VQHFYSNRYITDCGIAICRCRSRARRPSLFVRTDKQAPIATFRAPAAAQGTPGLLSEQTSKRPRTKDFKPIVVLPTAALQFAAAAWIPGKLLSEQTSKHPVNKGFQSLPHSYIMRTSRCGPWTPWETFVRTDKQAVIHRLFTVYGKVIHSFAP